MNSITAALAIPGWMTSEELSWLGAQASQHDVVVEVGCYQGRTTRALGDNARGTVYAVDDWKGLRGIDEEWWQRETPKAEKETLFERFLVNVDGLIGKVVIIHADHAKVPELPLADMVFIDGDHGYESVKRDINTWLPRLQSGGLLCGHDFNQEMLARAVRELLPGATHAVGLIWSWIKP
jgi:predicted O-methyltransferase YrrM